MTSWIVTTWRTARRMKAKAARYLRWRYAKWAGHGRMYAHDAFRDAAVCDRLERMCPVN